MTSEEECTQCLHIWIIWDPILIEECWSFRRENVSVRMVTGGWKSTWLINSVRINYRSKRELSMPSLLWRQSTELRTILRITWIGFKPTHHGKRYHAASTYRELTEWRIPMIMSVTCMCTSMDPVMVCNIMQPSVEMRMVEDKSIWLHLIDLATFTQLFWNLSLKILKMRRILSTSKSRKVWKEKSPGKLSSKLSWLLSTVWPLLELELKFKDSSRNVNYSTLMVSFIERPIT